MLVAVELPLQRTGKHFLVADHPIDLGLLGEPDHALPHRHLGRPHALRPPPEHALEKPHAQLDLALRVLAMREVPLRQLDMRVGASRGVDVADEWKDGVVVGRKRQLRLPTLRKLAVLGDHAADTLELRGKKDRLVVLREVTVLALQLRESRVRFNPNGIAPREVEPDLEIADVLVGELGIRQPRGQVEVSRRLLHAKRPRRLSHPPQYELPLLGGKLAGGALAEVEEQVDGFFLAVVLNLSEQRRHEVEGRTDLGISVQQRRHLEIVLGRSQANPRQKVGAREVVLVIRLMHVPDEGDVKRLGHAVTSMIAASASGLSASWRALTAVVSQPASLPRSPRAGSAGRSTSPTRTRGR